MSIFKVFRQVANYVSNNGLRNTIKQVRLSNELRFGELKGQDQFGNRYFESLNADTIPGRHRWVESANTREFNASNVPAEWHSWLHYTSDQPISNSYSIKYKLKHQPTALSEMGTNANYLPPSHYITGAKVEAKTAKYDSWNPTSPPDTSAPKLDQK